MSHAVLWPVVAAFVLAPALAIAPPPASAQGVVTFSAEDLMKGTKVDREACGRLPAAVFVEQAGEAICFRYYPGAPARGKTAAVFFSGDVFGFDKTGKVAPDPGYLTQAPEYVDAAARVWSKRLGVPVIFFGRMGMHGSSGWHGHRRTTLEVEATLAALDAIAAREGITGFHVAGQSGGGILAAAVAARRADVGCATIASAPLAFEIFAKHWGIRLRRAGKLPHYDNMKDVADLARRPARVIQLTDPKDQAVPPASQTAFADALQAAGGKILRVETSARGREHHALTEKALFVTALCIAGKSDADILARYGGTAPEDLPPP